MRRIKAIYFANLRAEAHLQFLRVFCAMVEANAAAKSLLATFLLQLELLLEKERLIVDASRKKPETTELRAADNVLDDLLLFIKGIVRGHLKNPSSATAAAAAELLAMMETDFKNIQRKEYESEIAAVSLLLDKLRGQYLPQSTAIGIVPYFDQLQGATQTLEGLLAQRNAKEAARLHETMAEIHQETDPLYGKMISLLEAAIVLDAEHMYDPFIAELNEKIRDTNERHLPHKRDIAEAIVANVPDQTLDETGYATPLCNISIKGPATGSMVRLIFAKDYTTTYRRNNKIGNAEMVVHGKGGYKGQKVVTFTIIEDLKI
jgi:type I restriction-modification system DNA methylase subunit